MKKKPSAIFSILINILNNLNISEEYSINEISEKSGLHWKTTKEYLDLLLHLFRFSPKIKYNGENNKIQILNHSNHFEDLSLSQKILVNLYENRSFDDNSALKIKDYILNNDIDLYLEELLAKEHIYEVPDSKKYYITKAGKIHVLEIYSEITKEIFNIQIPEEIHEKSVLDENKIIKKLIKQNNDILIQTKLLNAQNRELTKKLNHLYQILGYPVGKPT